MNPLKKKLIVIVGPTAIGKTTASIALAKHLNTEIISADSRQFYKEMSIGTAKPSLEELQDAPHHFIDFLSIHDSYNAGQFEREALDKIESLFQKHDHVIAVGGSGLYINALCYGLDDLPSDLKIREELNESLREEGISNLQNLLKSLDPIHHAQMDIQNPQRLIRALEVCLASGQPYSGLRSTQKANRSFEIQLIGLSAERSEIYDRINRRVDLMMEAGLLEETRKLYPYKNLNALNTVGYKEFFAHFNTPEDSSIEEVVEQVKTNTRRFAKRQLTWFNKNKDIQWVDYKDFSEIISLVE